MKLLKTLPFVLLTLYCLINMNAQPQYAKKEPLSIATYVSNNVQQRSVKLLIKSLHDNGGKYSNSKVYVCLTDPEKFPFDFESDNRVITIPLSLEKEILDYPIAVKAFAAAVVEELVKEKTSTLAWFDPGTVILNPPVDLDLKNKYDIVVRPVTLANNIATETGNKPNEYWQRIFSETKVDYTKLPTITTIADEKDILPYYNCEVFAVNPSLGIFEEWARILKTLLNDTDYQEKNCAGFLNQLFLHQAVLSGVIVAKIPASRIKNLPLTCAYPFSQHKQLSEKKQVKSLNECSIVIFDQTLERDATWMNRIPITDRLNDWLFEAYTDYLKLSEGLYRIEGSSNSYLVITNEGSVLIDPAGASIAPEFYNKIILNHPLKAILLTHAHQDHSDDIAKWKNGKDIPVIAQKEFKAYFEYISLLSEFFARRNAVWQGKEFSGEIENKPDSRNEPTVFFENDYQYELGGIHFNMIHTTGETQDHTTIWIPELKAVFVGDNYFKYFINNATFRGTKTRPIMGYIHALDTALSFSPDYFLPGHDQPINGNKNIAETVGNFRDALKYIFDKTIEGMNAGKDVYTLMQEITLPAEYNIVEYFGKISWTVHGIYNEYAGWFDENPASMYNFPPSSVYADITELAGGADKVANLASTFIESEDYVKVLFLTEMALKADPENKDVLSIRLQALKGLKQGPYNYIERLWLNNEIRAVSDKIESEEN